MYLQDKIEVLYPPVGAGAWVVISRSTERPDRITHDLSQVDMAAEFALPLPTSSFPTKFVDSEVEYQLYDDTGLPIYDDGNPDGTTSPESDSGLPWPPKTQTETVQTEVNMLSNPGAFSLEEVSRAVVNDLLSFYGFYTWGQLILFDDRQSSLPSFEGLSGASGLGCGSHPLFIGPIQGRFSAVEYQQGDNDGPPSPSSAPVGHIMVVAPEVEGANWYFQISHGTTESNNFSGPVRDIPQASRLGEIFRIFPMCNIVVAPTMVLSKGRQVHHFWVRTGDQDPSNFQEKSPVIPWIAVLGKDASKPELGFIPSTFI